MDIIDRTTPIAGRDYECGYDDGLPPHIIRKGQTYVRVVFKEAGKFRSVHYCVDCWRKMDQEDTL